MISKIEQLECFFKLIRDKIKSFLSNKNALANKTICRKDNGWLKCEFNFLISVSNINKAPLLFAIIIFYCNVNLNLVGIMFPNKEENYTNFSIKDQ